MPSAIVLCGLPATGKSTWVKNSLFWFDEFAQHFVTVSSDSQIEQIARAQGMTYNQVFADKTLLDQAMAEMDLSVTYAMPDNCNIVWDQTNLTVKKRRQVINRLRGSAHPSMPRANYKITAVVFQPPSASWQRDWENRLKSRDGKTIPANVLKSMAEQYVMPTVDEGFDRVIYVNTFVGGPDDYLVTCHK